MDLFTLVATLTLDIDKYMKALEEAQNNTENKGDKIGSAIKKIGTIVASAFAVDKIKDFTVAIVNAYGEYEQLVGGIDTLFKTSSETVQKYAEEAYMRQQISANDYMNLATSFSASLISSLGGDTAKAAEVADMAITDMSDNANKMGTDISMIQNAYQGFAKQNYTMLDNLKLGYGGTKEEMERLLEDATKLSGIEYDISSFADVAEAIHVIQENMGIAGTSMNEAMGTVEGSINMTKAAWENFVVGLGDSNADLTGLLNNLITSAGAAASNVIPVIGNIGSSIVELAPQITSAISETFEEAFPVVAELAPQMLENLVSGIETALPLLADSAYNTLTSFGEYLQENLPTLLQTGLQMLLGLSQSIRDNAGIIVDGAINLAISFAQGLANSIPTIVQYVPTIISNIAGVINDNAPKILAAAVQIAWTLITGLIQSIPTIVANIPQIINAIVDVLTAFSWLDIGSTIIQALSNGVKGAVGFAKTAAKNVAEGLKNAIWNLPSEMMSFGRNVISFFSSGISGMVGTAGSAIKAVASAIKSGITGLPSEVLSIGKNIVTGLWNGINGKVSWIKDKILGFAGGIVSSVKSALGIKSPSRVMRDEVGKYIPMGLSKGIEENAGYVKDAMAGIDDIVTTPIDAPKVNGGSSSGFTYGGTITINVYASEGQDAKEIAQEVSEILAKQTQRKKAVYGN